MHRARRADRGVSPARGHRQAEPVRGGMVAGRRAALEAVRASAGALLHLPHPRVANIARALERLKAAGFSIVGLDEEAEATVYDRPCPPGRVALVVGSEGEGLSRLK